MKDIYILHGTLRVSYQAKGKWIIIGPSRVFKKIEANYNEEAIDKVYIYLKKLEKRKRKNKPRGARVSYDLYLYPLPSDEEERSIRRFSFSR